MARKHDPYQSKLWREQIKEDKRGYVHILKEEK